MTNKLQQAVSAVAERNPARFNSLVEAELRRRIHTQIMATKPALFTETAGARGGEARFKMDHGMAMHRHSVATEDNFKSDLPKARRPADADSQGHEERADPESVPAKAKDLMLKGSGVNKTELDDNMSMSAREFLDFVDDSELHNEAVERVLVRHLSMIEAEEYDRRVAARDLREVVAAIAPAYTRTSGNRVAEPLVMEVARALTNRLERL